MTHEQKTQDEKRSDVRHGSADPELYHQLSEPHESAAAAEASVVDFLVAVAELRKVHRIPELVIAAAAFFPKAEGETINSVVKVIGYGSPENRAFLSANLFNGFALPMIEEAQRLAAVAYEHREDDDGDVRQPDGVG
jgi:hypothetical protein